MERKGRRIGGEAGGAGLSHRRAPFHGAAYGAVGPDYFGDAGFGDAVLKGDYDSFFREPGPQERHHFRIGQLLGHKEDDIVASGHFVGEANPDGDGEIHRTGDMGSVFAQGFDMGLVAVDEFHVHAAPCKICAENRS